MTTAEDMLQRSICDFASWACPADRVIFHSVPNGLPTTPRAIARFKKTGLKPGVADLVFVIDSKAHYLEVKSPLGVQSVEQKAFEAQCKATGTPYSVCRSLDEAKTILQEWNALRGSVRLAA